METDNMPALDVMCPVCGVPAGQKCVHVRPGVYRKVPTHRQRYAAAKPTEVEVTAHVAETVATFRSRPALICPIVGCANPQSDGKGGLVPYVTVESSGGTSSYRVCRAHGDAVAAVSKASQPQPEPPPPWYDGVGMDWQDT